MSENIKTVYKNGVASYYNTQSTEDLHIPSLGFTKEEAELGNTMVYVFRVLGIKNGWTE